MGRPPRLFEPDALYHLTQHGLDDRALFRDAVDFQAFALRLVRVLKRADSTIWAVCLMPTHYHAVLSSASGELGRLMRDVNGGYARAFNGRHGRRGAVFERRYRDTRIRDDEHLGRAIDYVGHNPVKDRLVERIEDWPWTTAWDSPLAQLLRPWRWEHRSPTTENVRVF